MFIWNEWLYSNSNVLGMANSILSFYDTILYLNDSIGNCQSYWVDKT